MKARALIGGSDYPPDVLKIIFEAFDGAWTEVGPGVGTDPTRVEMARLSLAEMVLALAKVRPVECKRLKNSAVMAFRIRHRV